MSYLGKPKERGLAPDHQARAGRAEETLAELIREERRRLGLTQAGFARRLGVENGQYVSKLETGRVGVPSSAFLRALATQCDRSTQELLALGRDRAPKLARSSTLRKTPSPPFKLVFGHCLWGSPVFLAAHRGMLSDFSVASYTRQSERGHAELAWIVPDSANEQVPGPGTHGVEPLSAVKILDLLEKEAIDVGVIPGNIIWGRGIYQRFMKIGTIVDSATGCTFVCDAAEFPHADRMFSTTQLFDQVLQYAKSSGKKVRVAVENGTVADRYLCRAFDAAEGQLRSLHSERRDLRYLQELLPNKVRWHCDSSALAHHGFAGLREACAAAEQAELLGVITWEPHATWLEQQDAGKSRLKKVPLYFSPDVDGHVPLMSFDLVMLRSSDIGNDLKRSLHKLMQKLWQNATLLSELDGSSFDSDPLSRIGNYFGLVKDRDNQRLEETELARIRSSIRNIRYSVHWAMESQSLFDLSS